MQLHRIVTCVFLALLIGANTTISAQKVNTLWVHGDSLLNTEAFYGQKGVPGRRNHPGRRSRAAHWTDDAGNFWLYGGAVGYQFGVSGGDLWKWDGKYWTWVGGDSIAKSSPYYGVKGVPAASNTPGGLQNATCAYRDGKLFLFGGIGIDKDGDTGYLNNLWSWDGTTWTWLSGDAEVYATGVLGIKGQISLGAHPGSRYQSSSIIDEDGNFWLYGGYGQYTPESSGDIDDLWMWDGENWIWMSGTGKANQLANYGTMNVTKPSNSPGGRGNVSLWYDSEGNLEIFAGETTTEAGATRKYYADLWEWDGMNWTWISGDTTSVFSRHNTLYTYDSTNRVGHRRGACHWQDHQGNVWLFGGFGWADHSNGMLNDLWKWDGSRWYWMGGGKEAGDMWHYGEKGVASEKNWPKARTDASFWMDRNHHFWVHGGTNTSAASSLYGDLWEFDPQFAAKIIIYGNDLVIEDGDSIPRMADYTDFGTLSIHNIPIRKTFVVANHGSVEAYLPNTFATLIRKSNGAFRVMGQPRVQKLAPGDTLHFTIEFNPTEEKFYEAEVVFRSHAKDPEYYFKVQGQGKDIKLLSTDNLGCSNVNLLFANRSTAHYTLLIADSASKLQYPENGKNYNYSPNYSKAPRLNEGARIIYQGAKRQVKVTGLISGRKYWALLVPGDGLPGRTVYYRDSASVVYFETPSSVWQDSIAVYPSLDTGTCSVDTLIFGGKSPFELRWMDGLREERRILTASENYFFLTRDIDNCLLSSDSVELTLYSDAEVYSIQSSSQPWCQGDTVELEGRASHDLFWNTGNSGNTLKVTENGTYVATSTTEKGCFDKDSISIQFSTYPTARFLADTFWTVGDEVVLSYESDADEVFFGFGQQSETDYRRLAIAENGWAHLIARNRSACQVMDTAYLVKRELVFRAFPNAFSPNRDGLNESWFFLHEADSGKLIIFDRWGEIVHVGNNAWDGMLRGEVVPIGEYFYRFEPYDGDKDVIMGSIKVIR